MSKLSGAQRIALMALDVAHFDYPNAHIDAYTLRSSIRTLDALVRRGLATRKLDMLGSFFSPRTSNRYRITPSGLMAAKEIFQ